MESSAEESKKANAELTGEKAKAKGPKPWFLRGEVLATLGVIAFIILANTIKPIDNEPSQTSVNETSKATQEAAPPKPVAPWYPSGFEELTSQIAIQYFENGTSDCGYSGRHACKQMYVVTNIDCKIFVTLNFLVNDVVVDNSIDSATVEAGELAILSFASFEVPKYTADSFSLKVTEATCY
jgi:hypothetical protein